MKKTVVQTPIFRAVSLIFALLMLLGTLSACGGKKQPAIPDATSNEKESGSAQVIGKDSEEQLLKPEKEDFGGYPYTMLVETNEFYYSLYLWEEETAPSDFIDIAIWSRQQLMSEAYNVDLRLVNHGENAANVLANAAMVNAPLCDVVLINAKDSMEAAAKGYLLNVNQLPNLNLDASYWDQRIQEEYRIGDMLFHLEGDYTYLDEMRTYVMAYNEAVYYAQGIQEKYGSPYEMVASGSWTYAVMMEMIRDMARDANSDGKMNEQDVWGMVSEKSAPYYFFMGSGLKTVSNHSGTMNLNLLDSTYWQRITGTLDTLMEIGSSPDVLIANRDGAIQDSDKWVAASNVFAYDRALFRSTSLSAVMRLTDMKSNYGIMPIPAYEKGQTGYYCWVNPYNHHPLAFYKNTESVSKSSKITEILCYHSRYGTDSLYTAFFDELAYTRLCRKNEDYEMLRLIIDSKTFDIDYAADFTGITRSTEKIVNGNSGESASTAIAANRENAKKKVQDFVTGVMNQCPGIPNT